MTSLGFLHFISMMWTIYLIIHKPQRQDRRLAALDLKWWTKPYSSIRTSCRIGPSALRALPPRHADLR